MIFEVDNKKVFSSDIGQTFDENKHTIILIHGSGQSHVVWSLTDQYLADEGFNVFALDLPGHGNSEGASLKSIEDMNECSSLVYHGNFHDQIIRSLMMH